MAATSPPGPARPARPAGRSGAAGAGRAPAVRDDDDWARVVEEPEVPPVWLDPVAWEAPRPGDPDYEEAHGLVPVGDPVAAGRAVEAEGARLAARLAAWPPAPVLEATAPGPELAGLLAEVDVGRAGADQLIAAAAAAARLGAWAAAQEVAATIGLLDRVRGWRGVSDLVLPGRPSTVSPARMVATELAAAMSLSPGSAGNRVAFAAELARLPGVRAALGAGRIDWAKAKLVVEQSAALDDPTAAAVATEAMAYAPGHSYAELRRKLSRAVIAADPAAAERRHQRGLAERGVSSFPAPDGMAQLCWTDSAERIDGFEQWLTGRAQRIKNGADPRGLDQIRADILADLGRDGLARDDLPTRHGREPHIQVVVAAATLLGLDEQPAELAGHGPITAATARRIAAEGTWRRILTDPRTGRFDEMSVESYEPPQDMRDHVIARDRTCLAPGCRIPADRCDLDHHIPHPRGPTSPPNLGPFCRPFHQVKTFTDTQIEPDRDGGLRITLPSGRRYHRAPEPVLDHPALADHRHADHRHADHRQIKPEAAEEHKAPTQSPEDDIPPF